MNNQTDLSVLMPVKSETREHIIDTASELFYEKGYNLTGINEIIAEAGIAKATLYSHFKSKEDLALAYLDKRDQQFLKEIRSYCEERPQGHERIIGILEFLMPFFESPGFNGCWCIRTIAEIPRENKKIKDKIRENKKLFFDFIKETVRNNTQGLNTRSQASLANQVYIIYEGAITESHLQNEAWPIHEGINLLKSILNTRI